MAGEEEFESVTGSDQGGDAAPPPATADLTASLLPSPRGDYASSADAPMHVSPISEVEASVALSEAGPGAVVDMHVSPISEVNASAGASAHPMGDHGDGGRPLGDAAPRCPVCLEDIAPSEGIAWPHCGHPMHVQCANNWLRACSADRPLMPHMNRLARIRCPFRGAVLHGIGVEGCTQAFGDDAEAERVAAPLRAAWTPEAVAPPTETTVRQSVVSYGTLTYSLLDAPMPPSPPNLALLCHRRMGGAPPDMRELHDRRMQWAPVATHDQSEEGHRFIAAWRDAWHCHQCQHTINAEAVPQPSTHQVCRVCSRPETWCFDTSSALAEWRCERCDRDAWVRPVGGRGEAGQGVPGPLNWDPSARLAFEHRAADAVQAFFANIAQQVALGRPLPTAAELRMSALWSPWIWLTCDNPQPNPFSQALVGIAHHANQDTSPLLQSLPGVSGPELVRSAWAYAHTAFQHAGLANAAALHQALGGLRPLVEAWVQADDRLANDPNVVILDAHFNVRPGGYLQHYLQEFILTHVVAPSAELTALGDVLLAAACHMPRPGRQGTQDPAAPAQRSSLAGPPWIGQAASSTAGVTDWLAAAWMANRPAR